MAKKGSKKGKSDVVEVEKKITTITKAAIKDDFCVYGIEVKSGTGAGAHPGIKGIGIVDDDMKIAFAKMNAHLAALDNVFKEAGISDDIDSLHDHELTGNYSVTGFELKGTEEDPSVILIGSKFSETASGYIDIKIPKQNLKRGGYKWFNELAAAIDVAVREVELYHTGKYTLPVKLEEEAVDPKQLSITEVDFEEARVEE